MKQQNKVPSIFSGNPTYGHSQSLMINDHDFGPVSLPGLTVLK